VVLLSYDKAARRISFRHYSIVAQPSGVSKSVKALVGRRALPDMSAMQDVSEFLTRSGYGSVRHWSCEDVLGLTLTWQCTGSRVFPWLLRMSWRGESLKAGSQD